MAWTDMVCRREKAADGTEKTTLFFHNQLTKEITLETDESGAVGTSSTHPKIPSPRRRGRWAYRIEDPRSNGVQLTDFS